MTKNKGGLGRGLSALIPDWEPLGNDASQEDKDVSSSLAEEGVRTKDLVDVSRETSVYRHLSPDIIVANPHQPRRIFQEEDLEDLTQSVKEQGVLSPLLVTPGEEGSYILISGERRLRAAIRAGLEKVPVLVRDLSDKDMAEIALVENIQRSDLLPLEEAQAYADLMASFGLTANAIADRVGKSRSHIANMTRLLKLPDAIQAHLNAGHISAGHGRALLALDHREDQEDLANEIIRKSLSVRATEEAVKNIQSYDPQAPKTKRDAYKSPKAYKDLAGQISDRLQTQVKIKDNGKQGRLEISFYGQEDLKRILDALRLESY